MTHRITKEWLEEEIARHERLAREATDRRTAERAELAAAQAAIQRVDDELRRMESDVAAGFPNSVAEYAADLRRALDGDTTEEA